VELAGMKKDVAFASQQFEISERRACKLVGVDRGSYRYEPRPDRNAELRKALVELARHKPQYGYRMLCELLGRRGQCASVMRIYRLYRAENLTMRRVKRKRVARVPVASHVVRSNQEWAIDFVSDTLATGRGIRLLAAVDVYTRECLSLEVDMACTRFGRSNLAKAGIVVASRLRIIRSNSLWRTLRLALNFSNSFANIVPLLFV
jgi:putative transposase